MRLLARLRASLFVRLYLTLLGSILIVAAASALAMWAARDNDDRGWRGRQEAFAAAMLPEGAPAAEHQLVLDRLAVAAGADIALYGRDGEPIASAGAPLPDVVPERRRFVRREAGEKGVMVIELADGRRVVARLASYPFGGGPGWIFYPFLLAAALALAAWPVARRLTRRLERLRAGVDRFGVDDLAYRVEAAGEDEVGALGRAFNEAAERIERMIAANRALLANASHELRSPLARLRMASELHAARPDAANLREIERNLEELDSLVEEILLASRLDHVPGLAREPVDLLVLASEEAAATGAAVAGEGVVVEGDPRLLARLVRNLLANAQRHGRPPVEVVVGRDGMMAEITVRDHGDGIPEADREKVFEPFFRPSGRAEATGGWGLGLSLVRQIAERHGGTVAAGEAPGGGAAFHVRLPVAPSGRS